MTRDSDGGRPQKTVAELLAEHGGQVGGAPRRRRRRAAEDDDAPRQPGQPSISDTAPQAIIERVRSEGGTPAEPPPNGAAPAPGPDQGEPPPPPPVRRRPPRAVPPAAPQGTGGYPVPPAPPVSQPEEAPRPPLPPRQANGVAPANGAVPPPAEQLDGRSATRRVPPVPPASPPEPPPAQEGSLTARLDGLGDAPAPEQAPPQPPPAPPQGTGGFPAPPRRRRPPRGAPPPPPEPNTEQFPAVAAGPEPAPADAGPHPDEPPAGLSGWRARRRDAHLEDTEVGVMPAVPVDGGPPTQQGRIIDDADEGPPTGFYVPDFDDEDDAGPGAPLRTGVLDDDPLGEGGRDPAYDDPYDEAYVDYESDYEDYEAGYEDETAEDSDYAEDEEASPAKQWLALAGQLALGVAGGAAVWLGFNWLWGQLPAAALVAALVATVGLVWIVRKVRKAEDLQTTVLALLVGLVVTVSPAALLLVSR